MAFSTGWRRSGGRPSGDGSRGGGPLRRNAWLSTSGYQPRCIAISRSHSPRVRRCEITRPIEWQRLTRRLGVGVGGVLVVDQAPLDLERGRLGFFGRQAQVVREVLDHLARGLRIDAEAVERRHALDGRLPALGRVALERDARHLALVVGPVASAAAALHRLVGDGNAHFGGRRRRGGGRRGGLLGRACAKAKGQPGRGERPKHLWRIRECPLIQTLLAANPRRQACRVQDGITRPAPPHPRATAVASAVETRPGPPGPPAADRPHTHQGPAGPWAPRPPRSPRRRRVRSGHRRDWPGDQPWLQHDLVAPIAGRGSSRTSAPAGDQLGGSLQAVEGGLHRLALTLRCLLQGVPLPASARSDQKGWLCPSAPSWRKPRVSDRKVA